MPGIEKLLSAAAGRHTVRSPRSIVVVEASFEHAQPGPSGLRFGLLVEARIIVWPLGYLELFHPIPPWRVHEGVTAVAGHMLPAGGVAFILKPVFEGRGITVGVGFHRRPHAGVAVPIGILPIGFVD